MKNESQSARSLAYLKRKRDNLLWIRSRIIAFDARCVMYYESFRKVAESISNFISLLSNRSEANQKPLDYEKPQESSFRRAIGAIKMIGGRLGYRQDQENRS